MTFDLQSCRRRCSVGFRVEVLDVRHPRRNCTFDQHGNMGARNPSRSADARACFDHLSWRGSGGPFISFFTNWNAALHRRQRMIEQGATEVVIVAVWLEGFPGIYDAFMMARALGFGNQQLDPFLYEVLVYGGVSADSYRVLAMFHGIQPREGVALSVDGLTMMAEMPGDFVAGVPNRTRNGIRHRPNLTDKLRDEVHTHIGTGDDRKWSTSHGSGNSSLCQCFGRLS